VECDWWIQACEDLKVVGDFGDGHGFGVWKDDVVIDDKSGCNPCQC